MGITIMGVNGIFSEDGKTTISLENGHSVTVIDKSIEITIKTEPHTGALIVTVYETYNS